MGRQSNPSETAAALTEADIDRLQALLDGVPQPHEPLDVSSLDGYLCGVLLQPQPVAPERWLRYVTDIEGRALPEGFGAQPLHELVLRRHGELRRAIDERQWFDPWVFQLDDEASPGESVLPWVAGFAAAMSLFPGLMQVDDARLPEPLALLYLHLDGDDLEDAEALRALIETIEPPADLAEAVQDIVRSLMLIADVVRPREQQTQQPRAKRPPRRPR